MNETIIKVGDRVEWKVDRSFQGVVVGKAFGTPAAHQVRVQLRCGLTYDATPFALKKIEEFVG
jgi:hypothetical protein